MEIETVFEDENILAVNKPAGVLTHGIVGKKSVQETIADFFVKKFPAASFVGDDPENRPGIVHRLDRDTSGLLLLAKNQDAFLYLKNLFKERKIEKTYLAVVHGFIKEDRGEINKPIGLKSGTIKHSVFSKKLVKPALTFFQVIKRVKNGNDFSVLKVMPKTGRTHQIRVHLASINHPVLGDKLYGKKNDEEAHLFLHALSLEFSLLDGSKIKLEADPPEIFKRFLST
ncbi:MAG: RluA family pseudouridine synthase [Candidatus Pacebacteria bacterium]|nr:RluA family pseudouridine synthase [Candidatus Paceibacterota bacterium]